ncbi:MAG TPA: capsule assembly Wzi family protein [Rhizomicrobium sp.]|nr:capsule assembly Wzi family protein [Rhizomicrobium sp.]
MHITPACWFAGLLFTAALTATPAMASPWAEVGDNQLRGDIELLVTSGALRSVTIHWPLPWAAIVSGLARTPLDRYPAAVRAAAGRVLARAQGEAGPGLSASLTADATNRPGVVYGFDGMGRGDAQAQLSLERNGDVFSGRASLGVITRNSGGRRTGKLMPEGTYLSVNIADQLRVYAGYLDHWWGPGAISALSLSNNARPMPQVGIERASSAASSWPVLRWLGPWQWEFILGKLDGPQIQSNTYYNAMHITISPLKWLELGVSKTEQFCGQGHPCAPLRDYFTNSDFAAHPDNVNGEGALEIKLHHAVFGVPVQAWMQLMNEDYSLFNHSDTSHLFGASLWVPAPDNPVKLTAEFTDSIATITAFAFADPAYGVSYTNGQYPDGMRYRGRTLGFSLDDDSTLLSLQGSWTDAGGCFYELSLHHATIGDARSIGANAVSPLPVKLNLAEARIRLPFDLGRQGFTLDLAGRVQDDQPRPSRGFAVAIEAGIRIGL